MEDKVKEAKKEIAKIISEGVEYSPQLRTMVIHDAVEKLLQREQEAYNLGKEEDKKEIQNDILCQAWREGALDDKWLNKWIEEVYLAPKE